MRHYQYLYGLLLGSLLFSSCQGRAGEVASQPDPFFDLQAYMKAKIEDLNHRQPKVVKKIEVDGQTESHEFDSLDYQKELQLFKNSDINREAWVDKYAADSTMETGRLKRIVYTATDPDLKTQLLRVEYDEKGEVSGIYIENRTESIVADVRQDLHFTPGEGYRLLTAQQTALSAEKEIEIEVKW